MTLSTRSTARVPSQKHYATLLALASGAAGLSMGKRDCEPLLKRGWVTAEWRAPYYQWVRITPAGLRALAEAVERVGLPTLGPKPRTRRSVCGDCGSHRVRSEPIDAEEAIA